MYEGLGRTLGARLFECGPVQNGGNREKNHVPDDANVPDVHVCQRDTDQPKEGQSRTRVEKLAHQALAPRVRNRKCREQGSEREEYVPRKNVQGVDHGRPSKGEDQRCRCGGYQLGLAAER